MRCVRAALLVGVLSLMLGSNAGASLVEPRHRLADAALQVAGAPHDPPVDAPVIDPFRPPDGPYAAGNRGLEYDTTPGQIVRASSAGIVTFSGQVGGNLFVTIQHSSKLRTTVGFVAEVLVSTGENVTQGQVIARAAETLHFTARVNGNYIDPELLFQRYRVVVRLVSDPAS